MYKAKLILFVIEYFSEMSSCVVNHAHKQNKIIQNPGPNNFLQTSTFFQHSLLKAKLRNTLLASVCWIVHVFTYYGILERARDAIDHDVTRQTP